MRSRATGTSARALRPSRPSDRRSMTRPVAKAMNMVAVVFTRMGMHSTMTGRMLSIRYGLTRRKLLSSSWTMTSSK